jgi:hypothetical protein
MQRRGAWAVGNPTCTAHDPRLGRVSYRDHKRRPRALSVAYPQIAFSGIAAQAWTVQPLWLQLPLAIGYLGGPLADADVQALGRALPGQPGALVRGRALAAPGRRGARLLTPVDHRRCP